MRDLALSLLIPGALLIGLFSAPASVVVLNWIWFQRPYEFSWGIWATLPVFLIAVAVTVVSNLMRGQLRLKFPPLLILYLVLLAWITASAALAFDTQQAWFFYGIFVPSMLFSPVLMYATIHDLKLLKWVLWAAVGGIAINAAKVGIVTAARGGAQISDNVTGFVGDNNIFALVLCVVGAMLMGLRKTLPAKKIVRAVFFVIVGSVILCIVFTKSRGALLSLGVVFITASALGGKPLRHLFVLAVLCIGAYWAIPPEYFDRLNTLQDVGADTSAMGRVENWRLAWEAALANPLFGVGPENHIPYNRALTPGVQVRVAHSVYFQVLGEHGFPALAMYLVFAVCGLAMLFRTWRRMTTVVQKHPDLEWVRDLSFWTFCGYMGYLFGSGFVNSFYIEFPWYAVFYGSMLWPLVQAELAKRSQADAQANEPAVRPSASGHLAPGRGREPVAGSRRRYPGALQDVNHR